MGKTTPTIVGMALAGVLLGGCHPNSHKETVQTTLAAKADTLQNIEIADMDRNYVALYDEISKHDITIIDFWASWCGPCMNEMPRLVKLYADYKDSGLGIIGISLDKDHHAWQQAVAEQGMTWLQLSELRGWDCTAAQMNGVQSIPQTVVVDNKARILAKGLRGEELRMLIEDTLKGSDK